MKTESVEIYSDSSNFAVMRHPARRFPGSLIQGDSLFALVGLADEVFDAAEKAKNDSLLAAAKELRDSLRERLKHYEEALAENGVKRPY